MKNVNQLVDWANPEMLIKPRKNRPQQKETCYRVTCSQCGNERYLTKSAAKYAEDAGGCLKCHTSKIGKRGYQVAVERGLREKALDGIAAFQLANASKPERLLAKMLDDSGIQYERQKIWSGYILDFVIPSASGESICIEVNGYYWHEGRENRDSFILENYPGNVYMLDAGAVHSTGAEIIAAIAGRGQ